jgi:cellulose synthase/poly-beta-1,6-N-acetylglucosamine synthase-like glycosyltransferase
MDCGHDLAPVRLVAAFIAHLESLDRPTSHTPKASRRANQPKEDFDRRYDRMARLAGDEDPALLTPYRVRNRPLPRSIPILDGLMVGIVFTVVVAVGVWMVNPSHWPRLAHTSWWYQVGSYVNAGITTWSVAAGILMVAALCWSTIWSCAPRPPRPESGRKVTVPITYVPSSESLGVLVETVCRAVRMEYDTGQSGCLHVVVCDEGDEAGPSQEVARFCEALERWARENSQRQGVRVIHFSRRDPKYHGRYRQDSGPYKVRTKAGNLNAFLDEIGQRYDYIVGFDVDHAPHRWFLQRTLGFFRDPSVAFVVAGQGYGNSEKNWLTRALESAQFMFHSIIQPAGNRFGCPMMVGTNYVADVQALMAAGGFQVSVTEDLCTGAIIHAMRRAGRRAKCRRSVYTIDALAVGEGPESVNATVVQQGRWALGTMQFWRHDFWRIAPKLKPLQFMHYVLLTLYYPLVGISWPLTILSAMLYVGGGIGGLVVSVHWMVMLVALAGALHLSLYFSNRRHNVSLFESPNSSGLNGMFISMLMAPVYTKALFYAIINKQVSFAVTPKNKGAEEDHFGTFKLYWLYGAVLLATVVGGLVRNGWRPEARMVVLVVPLVICFTLPLRYVAGRVKRRLASTAVEAPQVTGEVAPSFDDLVQALS